MEKRNQKQGCGNIIGIDRRLDWNKWKPKNKIIVFESLLWSHKFSLLLEKERKGNLCTVGKESVKPHCGNTVGIKHTMVNNKNSLKIEIYIFYVFPKRQHNLLFWEKISFYCEKSERDNKILQQYQKKTTLDRK